jgi:hypothetical protein
MVYISLQIYGDLWEIHWNSWKSKKMMAINLWHHKWGKKKGIGVA